MSATASHGQGDTARVSFTREGFYLQTFAREPPIWPTGQRLWTLVLGLAFPASGSRVFCLCVACIFHFLPTLSQNFSQRFNKSPKALFLYNFKDKKYIKCMKSTSCCTNSADGVGRC